MYFFDVKMDFTRKARFVAGGHTTDTPRSITYSSVVSRDSMRLAFLIAGLNDLDVLAGDVTNAYLLNAKCRKMIWFEGGIETSEDRGKVMIVTRTCLVWTQIFRCRLASGSSNNAARIKIHLHTS